LLNTQTPLSIITVTGRNSAVRAKIEDVRCPERHHRKILGFTNQMDKLMGVADLIVSKPGGLTTSEALACGVPMIIVDPIPGQETRNSDFLLENGAAIKVNNLASLGHKISSVLGEPGRLNAMQAAARKLGRPNAAMEIAGHCLRLLDVPKPLSHFAIPRRRAGLGRTRALARAH
jgi:processive 1,2-diacylglycerol beta-glucosyltransferase